MSSTTVPFPVSLVYILDLGGDGRGVPGRSPPTYTTCGLGVPRKVFTQGLCGGWCGPLLIIYNTLVS